MSVSKNRAGVPTRRHARVIKVAPVTRAIRAALAVSATTLALTASGGVFAGDCAAPNTTAIHCNGSFYQSEIHPAMDLTLVHGDEVPRNVVPAIDGGASRAYAIADYGNATSAAGMQSFGDVQDLAAISALTPGPGGVPGSDNTVYLGASGVTSRSSGTGTFTATTSTTGYADFVFAASDHFSGFSNNASISATGYTWAAGFELEADTYASDVRNSATGAMTMQATGDFGQAWGIYVVAGGDAAIYNDGGIDVSASGYSGTAIGLFDYSIAGNASADNTGTITADASGYYGQAHGVYAAAYGDATTTNSSIVSATAYAYGGVATGTSAYSLQGDAIGDNSGTISAVSYGNATGMRGYAATGDVHLTNSGDIVAYSYVGNGIGMYGYALAGDVTIDNSGTIGAYSYNGLADGIFASGNAVGVTNSGPINVYGNTWAAGIEARGNDSATVDNSGVISVATYDGPAYGIYTTGGTAGVTVGNTGAISAVGLFSTGIEATASGNISITNTGDIDVGQTNYTVLATGIRASNNYAGSTIGVTNGGDINANGYYGATGIDVAALGTGGTANVSNSADIYASQAAKYGYGAVGIFSSADGNSGITNTGSITADSGGASYGAMALSFNGTANVTNAGDIDVSTSAMRYYSGVGILASSTNGAASAGNTGNITVDATKYVGTGIQVSGNTGALATNSGSIDVGAKYAYGIVAVANQGDVAITNALGGSIDVNSFAPNGFAAGLVGISTVGDVSVVNAGNIDAEAYGNAFGVFASPGGGNASVDNSGSIYAYSYGNTATGVLAQALGGDAMVGNSGDLAAASYYGDAVGIDASASGGNVGVTNGGSIHATSYYGAAIGVSAYSVDANVSAGNTGTIASTAYSQSVGIFAMSGDGNVATTNSGGIVAYSYNGPAVGAFARADAGDASIGNDGGIQALSPYGEATGARAIGLTAAVTNGADGTIQALSGYGTATGVDVYAGDVASVSNSGVVSAMSYHDEAHGIYALAGGDIAIGNLAGSSVQATAPGSFALGVLGYSFSGNITVDNAGEIDANGLSGALGIDAGAYRDAGITSSGIVQAQTQYGNATGLSAYSASGNATVDNVGAITSVSGGNSYGAMAASYYGDSSVVNSGDISATTTGGQGRAVGILSASNYGTATAGNSATITVAAGPYATGIQVEGYAGASATNSGAVSVEAKYANGVLAVSQQGDVSLTNATNGSVYAYSSTGSAAAAIGIASGGDVSIDNSGDLSAVAYHEALGIYARASAGDVTVGNTGDVHVDGDATQAVGIIAMANAGDVTITSGGGIDATSANGDAIGAYAVANGVASVVNSGTIATSAYGDATGVMAAGYGTSIDNSGSIHAQGYTAAGVSVYGYAGAQVVNSGTIGAQSTTGGDAAGVIARAYGNLLVYNTGSITATDDDYAVAVSVDSAHTATVVNIGTLRANSTIEGEIAVRGGDGVQRVFNYGDIYGAIVTGGGDDTLANAGGGTWHVANHSTDFGDGDDSITNGAGGTIVLADGAIHMGASGSAGNAFTNSCRIQVQGDGLIDMGGGGQTALLPSANALPLLNDGVVDFVDGAPDDVLTIAGDLAGSGAIDIDVSALNQGADLLYVEGNVVDGAAQTVNVSFAGFPTSAHTDPIAFAHVAGGSTADSFVAGQVIGFGANGFLDMQVYITSQLDATDATDDIFSVGVDVAGLNDPGTLAASIASGAQSLLTSQVGTWRQRMGVLPEKGRDDIGVSPWIRVFSDKGEVDPTHVADNFGNAGNFDYDQSNTGRELGMNINFRGGFNAGLLLAKSDGSQHLVGAGVGSDHISGSAFGLYSTWIGSNGFYVDASYRWFDFTAELRSAAGAQSTGGQGGAFNIESGFTAWKLAGVDITPQVQYTRSAIGNIRPVQGDDGAAFVANGGTSSRGRVGVAFSGAIDHAGWRLTPYGSVNAVREFDGRTDYSIADTFTGSTRTDGTSAMVELGIGAQKDGFSATAGANWTDGGALQSFVGGQLVLRYSW